MTKPTTAPTVPAPITASTNYKLLQPKRKSDPSLSKVAAAVAADDQVTVYLDDMEGWDLRSAAVMALLPTQVTRLMLFGKVDLALLRGFPNLQRLCLMGTIKNWEALREVPSLRVLDLSEARFPDLNFLGASRLEALNLHNCHLDSLANLDQLTALQQLDVHAKVKDADEWRALSALQSLQRAKIYTYSPVRVPDLRRFKDLSYLSISASGITFDPLNLATAPALQALGLDGAPFQFLASPQGVRTAAVKQWVATIAEHLKTPVPPPRTLKRVFFGDLPANLRQSIAEWLHVPCTREEEQLLKKHFIPIYDEKLEARAQKQFDAAVKAMQKRVKAAVGKKCLIEYAAFEMDGAGLPQDNLDEVCFEGVCEIEQATEDADAPYRSARMKNPTWLEMAVAVNAMVAATNPETDHRFLERLFVVREEKGVTVLGAKMGS